MKLYIYRNEDITDELHYPPPISHVDGETNEECEAKANAYFNANDFTFSYANSRE